MSNSIIKDYYSPESQALLNAIAEEIKIPLLHIARSAELSILNNNTYSDVIINIQKNADLTIELLDSYLLGVHLVDEQQSLVLEPVSAASVLYDIVQELKEVANRYRVELALDINGDYGPVMANRDGLKSALFSLGTSFIEAQPSIDSPRVVTFAAHRVKNGVVTGIYGDHSISPQQFRQATRLYNKMVRQPFSQFSPSSSAGIFVAQNIFSAMSSELRTIRYNRKSGFGATLQLSQQLELV